MPVGTSLMAESPNQYTALVLGEATHEADTLIFYNIIVLALKSAHTALVLLATAAAAVSLLKTRRVGWELLASLAVNLIFLTAFDVLAHIPGMAEACEAILAPSANAYEARPISGVTQSTVASLAQIG